jgi:hypothetical protein
MHPNLWGVRAKRVLENTITPNSLAGTIHTLLLMTKDKFDTYFATQIPLINDVSKRLISKYKKYYLDSPTIVSYAYEYCLRYIDDFETENMCQRYIFKFINSNIYWNNSELNKIERISEGIIEGFDKNDEDDELDYNNKLLIEKWYSNKKAILVQYRQYETDKVKQIVFDCFFKKDITIGIVLAKHLGINKDAGCKLIRDMKADIRNFENSQYRYDKDN